MPASYPKLPRLLAVTLLIICVAWPFSTLVEAKGKKGKKGKVAARSRGGSRKQISSSRRSSKKRRHRGRYSNSEDRVAVIPASYPIAPDRIEVIEHGSAPPPEVSRQLNPPLPRSQTTPDSANAVTTVAPRRKAVNINQSRTLQIQQALTKRGFYTGEMTGVYDQATIEAMRRFQASQKIHATGYPTAHALKRLGL